jgi:hypothetical protein
MDSLTVRPNAVGLDFRGSPRTWAVPYEAESLHLLVAIRKYAVDLDEGLDLWSERVEQLLWQCVECRFGDSLVRQRVPSPAGKRHEKK